MDTDPYIPIPEVCHGTGCAQDQFPEYTFTSSNQSVGNFVESQEAETGDQRAVKLVKGKPVQNTPGAVHSGLFCAFNAGETTVTITAGGLSSKLLVRIERGSVRQPCGTVKAEPAAEPETPAAAPAPAPSPTAESTPPTELTPTVPAPVTPAAATPAPISHPAPAPFLVQAALPPFIPAILPPPLPQPARPTPPSGTSAVTQPVEAPEKEEEEEAAPESVSAEATAYAPHEHEPSPAYILGFVVLAAFAGAGVKGGLGRRRKQARIAPATINTMRAQRRMERERDRFR